MSFPNETHKDIAAYGAGYFALMAKAAAAIDGQSLVRAADVLYQAIASDRTVYACGNGGSAAISNHLLCDFAKGIQTDTSLKPKIVSLSAHVELITAIGNDIAFDQIFAFQAQTAARPGDVLLTISSSGNSENIVKAIEWARANGVKTIALTGFDGGRSAAAADVNIHVPAHNYGVVEDLHQSVMHILAQYVRMSNMPADLISKRKF